MILGTERAYSTNTYANKQKEKKKKTAKLGEGRESNFQKYHIIKFKSLVFNKKGKSIPRNRKISPILRKITNQQNCP